jgi:glycosyltransferase involved in cell wall biosynthesis
MIDIHVIRYHSLAKPEWFERCAQSLAHPKVRIHEVIGNSDPHFGQLRVEGFKQGDGEYVSFIDDDDYLLPGAVDTQLDRIKDNDFIISGYSIEGDTKAGVIPSSTDFNVAKKRLYYFQGFKLIKRSVVEKYYGLLERCRVVEDALLWLALAKNHKGTISPEFLLHRVIHGRNATRASWMRWMNKQKFSAFIGEL